jgi:glycosyltransferase involved in cell wall biosynthesis
MTPLSVVIISLNEERNIKRCIDSVKDIADEIIVVDSFSTDKTKEISIAAGAKVIEKIWGGYGDAKNFGAAQAANDFILNLDADEALTPELRKNIAEMKSKGLSGAYKFNRLTNYCGKWIRHCGWYPDRKTRVYSRKDTEWNNQSVHEKLIFRKNVPVTFLKGDLEHYSFYSIDEHKAKAKKYARLGAQKIMYRNKFSLFLKMLFNPPVRFLRTYLLQLGFLDGYYGWKICSIVAVEVFMKYRIALNSAK